MIPARVELFAADSTFLGSLLFEEIESQAAEGGHVLRGVSSPGSALILPRLHVQNPVELVLNSPMPTHRFGEGFHTQRQARQEVATFDGLFSILLPDRFHHTDRGGLLTLG